jgi:hypothetical protein
MIVVATDSVASFFHDVVEDAIRAKRVEATDGATSYLVALLSDYAHPGAGAEEALTRPLAFLLDEALHTAAPAERFDRLRRLGDAVLYSCGFFGDHFRARGIDQSYLIGIGSVAYGTASSMLRGPATQTLELDIYSELASKFASFVAVLCEVADGTIAQAIAGVRDLVKVYERWLRTGSDRLAQALTSHGLVPTRGGGKGVLQ